MAKRVERGFPRSARLLKRSQFDEVYRLGRRAECRLLVVLALKRPGMERRLGIVASRKVGGAVARNRCKRLIREAFRRNRMAMSEGWDVVVVARRPLVDGGYGEVEREFLAGFRRCVGAGSASAEPDGGGGHGPASGL